MRRLEDALVGANSFNLVRLLAAGAVVVSHSFALIRGELSGEPLFGPTRYTLGQHAVNVFFVLSGVMVSRSFSLNPDPLRFAKARILRVFPGLIACGVVTALVFGAIGSTRELAAYYGDPATMLYPFKVPIFFNGASLDEVFAAGTKPGDVNNPLWTIKYELTAYAAFGVVAALGLMRGRVIPLIAALGMALVVIAIDVLHLDARVPALLPISRFYLSFALGVVAFAFRHVLPLRPDVLAALAVAAILARGTAFEKPAFIILSAYGALCVGSLLVPYLSAWTGRTDISYGLYLYAWPVQQSLLVVSPKIGITTHVLASLSAAAGLGLLSWLWIEKPALSFKGGSKKESVASRGVSGPGQIA